MYQSRKQLNATIFFFVSIAYYFTLYVVRYKNKTAVAQRPLFLLKTIHIYTESQSLGKILLSRTKLRNEVNDHLNEGVSVAG